jgi:hypothetical protein
VGPVELAIIGTSLVSVVATVCMAFCARILAQAASERRRDLVRIGIAERKGELATSAVELASATFAETTDSLAELEPVEEALPTAGDGISARNLRSAMNESLLDPRDPEDIAVYESMQSAGLDPKSAEDRMYWNMIYASGGDV